MNAIVLAAGRGSRLGALTDDCPKSLLAIGGRTLIERHLTALRAHGCTRAVVVAGYLHERVERAVRRQFDETFCTVVVNPDPGRGSGSSVVCAAHALHGDVLLIEADVLCDEAAIGRLLSPGLGNAIAIGHFAGDQVEGRVKLRDGYVESLRFGTPPPFSDGDWVGLTRLAPAASAALRGMALTAAAAAGELRYARWIIRLVERFPFRGISIDDVPWIEIDTPADLQRAETDIAPRLSS